MLNVRPTTKVNDNSKDLVFHDDIFFMAAALDPNFGFRWLGDLTCSMGDKEEQRQQFIGII